MTQVPLLDIGDVHVLVYDLDGTLYEDTRHFAVYAQLLRDQLPDDMGRQFWEDYQAACTGKHPLRIGRAYDDQQDLVLELDDEDRVTRAWRWDGSELEPDEVLRIYPAPVADQHHRVLSIGDGWWVPGALAHRYGITNAQTQYHRTKEILATEPGMLTPVPGLAEALTGLQGHVVQLLATNSDAEDTQRLLQLLGLAGCFDQIHTLCNKPAASRQLFVDLCGAAGVSPDQMVSIGDNYRNEIRPALATGCRAIYIDPQIDTATPGTRLARVPGTKSIIPWLQRLAETRVV